MSIPLNILITSAHWQSALACIQSLGRAGHNVLVWTEFSDHPNLYSKYIYKSFIRELATVDQQILDLSKIIIKHSIDFVIPISDEDAEIAAKVNVYLGSRKCIIGDLESVVITRDRNRTYELCQMIDVKTPHSMAACHQNAKDVAEQIGYPCLIKLSQSVASSGVIRVENEYTLKKNLSQIPNHSKFQLQKEIEGKLSDITGFAVEGELIESFAFEFAYEHSHGGNPPYALEVRDRSLEIILEKISKSLNWTGGIDLDLLTSSDGNHYLLEINPRLSGTSVFAYKSGIDFAKHYISAHKKSYSPKKCAEKRGELRAYISLLEEAHWLCPMSRSMIKKEEYTKGRTTYDNGFKDDEPYSEALFRKIHHINFQKVLICLKRKVKLKFPGTINFLRKIRAKTSLPYRKRLFS